MAPLFQRTICTLIAASSIAGTAAPACAGAVTNPTPETKALAEQVGSWTVTDTFQSAPEAAPQRSAGMIAERRMVGSYLEETLRATDANTPLRIDYLGYDTIAGQWRYVSVEARIPVAPMPAASFSRDLPEHITLRFDPFAAPPMAPGWAGRMLRMEEVITRDGPDHETKDQYFILADGSGARWLAHRYDYRRRL